MGIETRISPEEKTPNERAVRLVVRSIAQYPQDDKGAPLLIADRLLHPDNTISLKDFAKINPEPIQTAKNINKIHRAQGIDYVVSPKDAKEFVVTIAGSSLGQIKAATIGEAAKTGTDITPLIGVDFGGILGRQSYLISPAERLERFLREDPELAEFVRARVAREAAGIRARSPDQIREARAFGDLRQKERAAFLKKIAMDSV